MQYTVPCLIRRRHYLQMLVLLTVLLLTWREQAAAPARWMKNQRNLHTTVAFLAKRVQNRNCVQTLSQTVAAETTKITSVEQIVSSLAARVATSETSAASASSGSGSARYWNLLGQSDGSTALGPLGPL